ncbi:hypothetical protein HAX54_019638, partial [Datura stramonium]|nr:hypothetical protein [Datura stramonium]
DNYKSQIRSLMVCWHKPKDDALKLNTNGSYRNDQNTTGAGGIVRNKNGDLIMDFAYPSQFYTNNISEA